MCWVNKYFTGQKNASAYVKYSEGVATILQKSITPTPVTSVILCTIPLWTVCGIRTSHSLDWKKIKGSFLQKHIWQSKLSYTNLSCGRRGCIWMCFTDSERGRWSRFPKKGFLFHRRSKNCDPADPPLTSQNHCHCQDCLVFCVPSVKLLRRVLIDDSGLCMGACPVLSYGSELLMYTHLD